MQNILESEVRLKEVFKAAIIEVLQERKDLVSGVFEEIIEDIALSRAITEGEGTPTVSRDEIFELLETAN